ncbi:MAG: nitroreductase [Lachnospiraceae bacterium]|nr:nitroreductase [Lachnospiraceae bacterium]
MEALEAILTRRSTRKYKDEVPSKELLEKVIEAGRYAPSGSNSQKTHCIVFTDRKMLDELAEIVKGEFAKMELDEDAYISLKNSVNASKKGTYVFHYGAPVFIVVANKKDYGNAMADSACALENMMIAANALDLGSCWINQLHWLDSSEAVRKAMYAHGLGEDETITGGLIVGYPAEGLPNRKQTERTGNPITWL